MKDDLPSTFGSQAAPSVGSVPDAPPRAADGARYTDAVAIGSGGMGRVSAVRDTRLDRTVALKEALDEQAARRLAREAALTARLEHPGIVTVLDAGTTDDGHPYYTMQLIRGRTLAEVMAQGPPPHVGWIRAFLAVCEAVAYAHDRGVVHRDLKPLNILVGRFGETQVVDWGLAIDVTEPPRPGVTGSPGWRSPEQERGEAGDQRTDVWGLGAVLHALLTAEPPGAELTGPRELQAIVRTCLAEDPIHRYPDAAAVADDVRAWLDGLQVSAHEYSWSEHLVRAVERWRWPLAVGLTGLVVSLVALVVNSVQVTRERDLARAAEVQAEVARREAQATLQSYLASQAVAAFASHQRFEAERAAREALAAGPHPIAAGVLAGLAPEAPRVASTVPCEDAVPSPDGARLLCLGEQVVVLYEDDVEQWRHDVAASRGSWLGDTPVVQTSGPSYRFDAQGRPEPVAVVGLGLTRLLDRDGVWRGEQAVKVGDGEPREVCATHVTLVARSGFELFAMCTTGEVVQLSPDQPPRTLVDLGPEPWLSMDVAGDRLLAVATGGVLARIRLDGHRLPDIQLPLTAPDMVVAGGGRVAVSGGGEAAVLLRDGRLEQRLPEGHRVVWLGEGAAITTGREGATRWSLPQPSAWRYEARAGLSGITRHESSLYGTDGLGFLTRWDVATGAVAAQRRWRRDVLKSATVQGSELLVAGARETSVRRLDPVTLEERGHFDRQVVGPRLVPTDSGVVALSFGRDIVRWTREDDAVERIPLPSACTDGFAGPDGSVLLCGDVLRSADGQILEAVQDVLRIAPGDVRAGRRSVTWGGRTQTTEPTITSLTADDERVVAGLIDGTTRVWGRDHRLQLVLHGHTERVSDVVLDGEQLFTASWDGTARRWWLSPR